MNDIPNLNDMLIPDGNHENERQVAENERARRKQPTKSEDGNIEVYFDDLEDKLIEHINESRVVIGCVAWLTSERILDALSRVRMVSIIVQKEDFLRPDLQSRPGWSQKLRDQYRNLHGIDDLHHIPGLLIDQLSRFDVERVDAIRCVGNYNQDKAPAFPRSHHKFVLFQKERPHGGLDAVWTGSFNFTANATRSFENALFIRDKQIVQAYEEEFHHVLALSEPLDWSHNWVAPQYRIGT